MLGHRIQRICDGVGVRLRSYPLLRWHTRLCCHHHNPHRLQLNHLPLLHPFFVLKSILRRSVLQSALHLPPHQFPHRKRVSVPNNILHGRNVLGSHRPLVALPLVARTPQSW